MLTYADECWRMLTYAAHAMAHTGIEYQRDV
jgi:hypothetical protein